MSENSNYHWTVFFLIRAVDEFSDFCQNVLEQICQTPVTPQVSICICLNVDIGRLDKKYERTDPDIKKGHTTIMYKVVPGPSQNRLQAVEEIPAFDIREPVSIAAFLKKGRTDGRPNHRFLLFTWGHGAPVGLFVDKEDPLPGREGDTRMLTMDGLAEAMAAVFENEKFALIVMMNCYVQSFDAGFSLAPHTNYLVGAENYLQFEAYDYAAILQKIAGEPEISDRELSLYVVETYRKKNEHSQQGIALFANDLNWYHPLSVLLDQLAVALEEQLPAFAPRIWAAKRSSHSVDEAYGVIDLFSFIHHLRMETGMEWNRSLFEQIAGIYTELVAARFVQAGPATPRTLPTGISFLFPDDYTCLHKQSDICRFFSTTSASATLFTLTGRWNDFIIRFVDMYREASIGVARQS